MWSGIRLADSSSRSAAASTATWRACASSRSRSSPDEPDRADDPRQRQALPDQRGQDHAVRQVDDQVAVRNRRMAAPGRPRARPRRASRPSSPRRPTPLGGTGRARPHLRAEPPRDVRRREHPDNSRDDDRQADRDPEADQLGRARWCPRRGSRAAAGPISRKAKPLIRKITSSTRRGPSAGRPGDRARAAFRPAMIPAVDGGQHAAHAERLGRKVRGERRQQRERDLERGVGRPSPGRHDATPMTTPTSDAAHPDDDERGARPDQRERPGRDRHDRDAEQDQRGRVVDRLSPSRIVTTLRRHAEAAEDRRSPPRHRAERRSPRGPTRATSRARGSGPT